jgi:hypothetical protein
MFSPHRYSQQARKVRARALGVALTWLLTSPDGVWAGGPGAIWTTSFEHSDGLKISLVSSEPMGTPTSSIRACFVLSNTNTPPGALGSPGSPAGALISATDTNGSGLAFEFIASSAIDVGGIDVTCSIVGGSSSAAMIPVAPGPINGVIPASMVTNKCCFGIAAPSGGGAGQSAIGPSWLASAASSCDPAYPECFPGEGDELLYVLSSNSGDEPLDASIHVWTLGAPGCGLVGLESIAVLLTVRTWHRSKRRSRRRR